MVTIFNLLPNSYCEMVLRLFLRISSRFHLAKLNRP